MSLLTRIRRRSRPRNIAAVVNMILARRRLDRLDLIGRSLGATIVATHTARHPDKVDRLVP